MTTTDLYEGPERRRWRMAAPFSRKSLGITLTAAWVAIMVPLGAVLYYAHRSDDRAERAGRTTCELAKGVEHLAASLDGGLAYVLAGDPAERTDAEKDLAVLAESAKHLQEDSAQACRSAPGQ